MTIALTMTQAARDAAVAPPARRQVLIAFSGLLLGILLGALDQTILATALAIYSPGHSVPHNPSEKIS